MPRKPTEKSLANLNPLAAVKTEEEKASTLLKTYVTEAEAAIIRSRAKEAGLSVSEYIRRQVLTLPG